MIALPKIPQQKANIFQKVQTVEPMMMQPIIIDEDFINEHEEQETIHGYVVREIIGQTPTGVEMLVENVIGQKFILKAFDEGIEDIGRMEIKLLQILKGKKAVNMTDYFFYNKKLHMVMNYIPYSLQNMIYEQNITLKDIKKIMLRITNIIKYMHDQNILHGDIQPQSFRLTPNNIPSMIASNFQCARILSVDYVPQKLQPVHYRAPEIIQGKQSSKNTDMWSIGCLFYELIMKKPLFDVESLDNVVVQQLHLFKYQHLKAPVINKIEEEMYYKFSTSFLKKLGLSTKAAKLPVYHVYQTQKQFWPTINDEILCMEKWKQEDKENCIKLLYGLLNHDPNKRLSCDAILKSPFLQEQFGFRIK
ncbi:Kinase [Hexamita inflata]|uniref:CMGC CDK n=1 Tax=Hexamita inflata TaxID=28002 RepID=A0AA86RMG6_9EUKA|nr:CMGC CDK [Hexamita inflata]